MASSPFLMESAGGRSRYTHLFACISEEDENEGFTLQIRLRNHANAENTAWGEELTDCFETACLLVAALAAEFAIAPERIEIQLRMRTSTDGTRH
jgi:hypothetical protein